ncbi:hypothetical protein [Pseudomonas kitaguniensis]|uniref:hypothetical protein n=1 Tax=Pseudomonas kitaguniensis TaxID=2607908 RepID=UPI003D01A93D
MSIGVEWRNKPDAQYTDCVVPTLQGCALTPTVSQTQRKVFIDELYLLAWNLLLSSFERAIQKCICT